MPHPTMTLQVGVKVVLTDESGNFLLLKRSQDKYTDIAEPWDIVGGRIDPGMTLEENLRREVAEETGLSFADRPILAAAQDIMPNNDLHVVRLTFIAKASGTDVRLSDEHVDYRWFSLGELQELEGLDQYFSRALGDVLRVLARNGFASSFTPNASPELSKISPDIQPEQNNVSEDLAYAAKYTDEVEREEGLREYVWEGTELDENFVEFEGENTEDNGEANGNKEEDRRQKTAKIGKLGEDIAVRYLEERGFGIIERNYRRKWGEIDVVAKNGDTIHFVEVKASSVPRENSKAGPEAISRGTDNYRPEEHVHPKKVERLHRAIQSYLAERNMDAAGDTDWQLDVLAIDLDPDEKTARCRFIKNVV